MISKLVSSFFIVVVVLLGFSIIRLCRLGIPRIGAAGRFLIVMVAVIVFDRCLFVMSGALFSGRYFQVLTVLAIVAAAPGLLEFSEWTRRVLSWKIPSITKRGAMVVTLAIYASISLGKAWHVHFGEKRWIREMAEAARAATPAGKRTVVVSDDPDRRVAYYANADFVLLDDSVALGKSHSGGLGGAPGTLFRVGRGESVGKWIPVGREKGYAGLEKALGRLDGAVFVFVRMSDERFRKCFEDAGMPFPSLTLIKTAKDKKGRGMVLYRFVGLTE